MGAHITHLHDHFPRELLLDIQIVVLQVRRADVRVDAKGVRHGREVAEHRLTDGERQSVASAIGHGSTDQDLTYAGETGVRWARIKHRAEGKMAKEHVLGGGVVKDTIARAHDDLLMSS